MSSLDNRANTALLVIDMQSGVAKQAYDVDRVVRNIGLLVEKARSEHVPVVWVQHSDDRLREESDDWQLVPELKRLDDEPLVSKRFGDSFEESDLESVLVERRVGRLVVTGTQTDLCIRETLNGALTRGLDVTLVEDAHTTDTAKPSEDPRQWGAPFDPDQTIAFMNLFWRWSPTTQHKGHTVPTARVAFTELS